MVSDNAVTVADAFDVLLSQVEAHIALTDKAGAKAFEQRNYDEAQQALKRAGQLAAFQGKVMALRLDWEETFGTLDGGSGAGPGEGNEPPSATEALRMACIARLEKHLKSKLPQKSATTYASADGKLAVVCVVSKEHAHTGQPHYWFAFHTHQAEFLEPASQGYLALGCGTADRLLLIPYAAFCQWLDSLHTTERNDGVYWHIHVSRHDGKMILDCKKGLAKVDLTLYGLP